METDINHYTMDELFALLDIKITDKSNVDTVRQQIMDRSANYIKKFTEVENKDMATFFNKVRERLLGLEEKPEPISISNAEPFSTEKKIVTKLLNVDSRFRQNYDKTTSTDFLIDLPYPINNVNEIRLSDLELPATYYAIQSGLQNHYFWFATYTPEQIITEDPEIYYICIKNGNYASDTLVVMINEIMGLIDSTDVDFTPLPIKLTFDMDFNNNSGSGDGTGKVTLGLTSTALTFITRVDFNFKAPQLLGRTESAHIRDIETKRNYYDETSIPIEQRLGWMLGFRKSMYQNAPIYTSESILNVLGPQYLFLVVEDFNQSNNVNFIGTSRYGLLPDNILARISLKVPAFNIQSQNDFSVYSEPRTYFGPVNFSKIRVRLLDDFCRVLDLNSSDFSFTIRLTTVYSPGQSVEKDRIMKTITA